jgi:hypothetical protein
MASPFDLTSVLARTVAEFPDLVLRLANMNEALSRRESITALQQRR